MKSDFPQSAFCFLQRLSAFFNGFPLSSRAFCFLQRLSNFFNGFPIFLIGFPIFLNGFPLSEKSEKIYLRQQVYERSPFKLCISHHLLPELCNCHSLPELCNRHLLPELCNCHLLPKLHNCYNACISPNRTSVSHPSQQPCGQRSSKRTSSSFSMLILVWSLGVMDNRHVVTIDIGQSCNGDPHHAELVSNAPASMPNFMATNSAPKTDDSIVGCFCESQLMSNMFRKIRSPVRNCRVVLSPAWLLLTIMRRSTSFLRGGGDFFWNSLLDVLPVELLPIMMLKS